MREILSPVRPVASLWKASHYELQGNDANLAEYVAAAPGASWSRVDPFESYGPVESARRGEQDNVAHVLFLKMKSSYAGKKFRWKTFDKALKLFADRHGLLGLFSETFAAPVLPSGVDRYIWHLAPDTIVESSGKMRSIDPGTEGKTSACAEQVVGKSLY